MGCSTNLLGSVIYVHSNRKLIWPPDLHMEHGGGHKENAMDAILAMFGMLILRVILPIGVLLAFGEWAARHGQQRYSPR